MVGFLTSSARSLIAVSESVDSVGSRPEAINATRRVPANRSLDHL